MENLCRTCLRYSEKVISLNNSDFLQKIETIASIKIVLTDILPKHICEECSVNINKLFNFRKVILNSHRDLEERAAMLEKNRHKSIRKQQQSGGNTNVLECNNIKNDGEIFIKNEVLQIKTEASRQDYRLKDELNKNVIESGGEHFSENEDVDNTMSYDNNSDSDKDTNSDTQLPKANVSDDNKTNIEKVIALMRVFKCQNCDKTFTSRIRLQNHRRTLHYPKQVCNICGVIIRADNLKKHISCHYQEPVECKTCGKVCKNSESLRGHVLIHRGDIFTCEICGKTFRLRAEYRRHLKSHEDPEFRKQTCTVCGKKFRDLRRHILSHTGERPYLCTYCNKGFSSPHACKVHIRLHTNERPYMCDYCSMAFPQKVSLLMHIKSKHQEKDS